MALVYEYASEDEQKYMTIRMNKETEGNKRKEEEKIEKDLKIEKEVHPVNFFIMYDRCILPLYLSKSLCMEECYSNLRFLDKIQLTTHSNIFFF